MAYLKDGDLISCLAKVFQDSSKINLEQKELMQRDWTTLIALYCSSWKRSDEDAQNKFEYHIGVFYPK